MVPKNLRIIAMLSLGLCLYGSASAYVASQVNAKAVSVQWRHGIGNDWQAMCSECWNSFAMGAIVVYTIRNGAVQANPQTIYTREKGFATYPAFNFSGTKVAFFRSSSASTSATATSGTTVNGGKAYISLINADGTGLTNLAEIPSNPQGTGNGSEILPLDWPAGEWIYYERPYAPSAAWGGDPASVDIWRVNAVTLVNEQVCNLSKGSNCTYWRRFALSANADKLGGQTMGKYECNGGAGGGNCVWNFPIQGCDLNNGKGSCRAACNLSISPSGNVIGSYFSGAHTELELGQSTPGTYDLGWGWGLPLSKVEEWAGEDVGSGCELIRWAANSDKWVIQNVGWYGHASAIATGSNAVVANWVDRVAFNITKNPKLANTMGVMYTNNCAGDMWIDDPTNNPQNTKYEDLQGVWHVAPNATPMQSTGIVGSRGSRASAPGLAVRLASVAGKGSVDIDLESTSPVRIALTDVRGRTVREIATRGEAHLSIANVAAGPVFAVVKQDGMTTVRKIVVR